MNDLINIDKSFNESMFKSRANNIFIMIYSCIMKRDLNRVRHFISGELEKKYELVIEDLKKNKVIQMYDELNIKDCNITNIKITEDKIIIDVELISRYMDYKIDEKTKKYISGINDHRIEKINHLKFVKLRNAKDYKLIKKCPSCGSSIDLNKNGECVFCKSIFNTEDYDYILTSID